MTDLAKRHNGTPGGREKELFVIKAGLFGAGKSVRWVSEGRWKELETEEVQCFPPSDVTGTLCLMAHPDSLWSAKPRQTNRDMGHRMRKRKFL